MEMTKTAHAPVSQVDFSEHQVFVTKSELVEIYDVKVPGTNNDRVTFSILEGVTLVTGDRLNWVLDTKIDFNKKSPVDVSYVCDRIERSSKQNPYVLDHKRINDEICDRMNQIQDKDPELEEDGNYELFEYYERCSEYVFDGDFSYPAYAYLNIPDGLCAEDCVFECKKPLHDVLVITDAINWIRKILNKD